MIAIMSDIHGNYEALMAVLERMDTMKIEEIYCLGDIVGYYSQINECCNELRRRQIQCIMGNHDWYMASDTDCERSKSVRDCIDYQRGVITNENLEWLKTLPILIRKENIVMVHGGFKNPLDEYLEPSQDYFEALRGKFFASGHTHIQRIFNTEGKTYCNPGSVGQPRDGDNRAAFATFDGESFKLYRVNYNYKKVGELMEKAGFNRYYYGCLQDASLHLHA